MTSEHTPAIPPQLEILLDEWGPRWHHDIVGGREAMFGAWAPLLEEAARSHHPVRHDLAYGTHPRQVLDVHAPPGARGLPVMVFVHGGAFVRGDKTATPWIYANVPAEFSHHGFVAVNVEYRLAPEAAWPEGARDVRDALRYVAANAHAWGGDPKAMFLMGHSAACAHCATAAWDDCVRPPGGLPIQGLVLLSPRVVADQRPENPNAPGVRAYYGADESLYAERAPLAQVRADAPPTFVAVAEYENPLLDVYAFALAHRLAEQADRHGAPMPRLLQLPSHNHVSIVAQFDTPYNALGADIRSWCARVLRGDYARARSPAASMRD